MSKPSRKKVELILSDKAIDRIHELEPTAGQFKFAAEMVRTGKPLDSLKEAYPDRHGKYLGQDAQKLLRNPRVQEMIELIQQDVRSKFIFMSPEAQERLETLSKSAESEKVQLDANLAILDRGGFKPPERVELEHLGIFGQMSTDEIKEMLRKNMENKG